MVSKKNTSILSRKNQRTHFITILNIRIRNKLRLTFSKIKRSPMSLNQKRSKPTNDPSPGSLSSPVYNI
jgi:hypothetical protein